MFVISGCGSGINTFRRLQKEDRPFYAGILYENDVDYQVARNLAAEVVSEAPFMPISDAAYERALELMKKCKSAICTGVPLGESNRRIANLIEAAKDLGILEAEGGAEDLPDG